MEKAKQLSVTMENVPGQLERLCRVLAQAKVNIRGLSVADATDLATIRLLVSDPVAAQKALREAGLACSTQDVLVLVLDDKPGALEAVAARLGAARVNIHYIYGSGDSGKNKGILILKVDDVDLARQTLA
ncbi:MAG: ACT domain-containing protein [Planctomycetota bacterium]|nr:ACT domain-containing protein [Planctomycetota bacterium]